MKRKFFSLIIVIFALYLTAQEAVEQTDTAEEALCAEVAQDIINIYDNWDPKRDFDILYPRIKSYIDGFYSDFPDFNYNIIEKSKLDEPLNDYERRSLIAYKALKTDKIFEEVARFITTKDFYWGYIPDSLDEQINSASDKIKTYVDSRETELIADHEKYVTELLEIMRSAQSGLNESENISDIEIVDLLLNDDEYNNEMFDFQIKLDSIKASGGKSDAAEILVNSNFARISYYIEKKRKEYLEEMRNEYVYSKEDWVEAKRMTLFDLKEEEYYRLSDLVSEKIELLAAENNITAFDINDELIKSIKENPDEAADQFRFQIKNKFYSGLTSTFGSYVLFDSVPIFRTFRLNVFIGTILFMILFFYVFIQVKKNREKMFIRKIPGLDAIDDAVGRATEMGKPIVYDSGLGGYTHIDTIASMLILKSIAKKVAEFKAEIYVPTCDPIILQISEEMVASGFLDAGYPEDHKKDNIFFIAYDQFAFAAGVAGILSRKKPATAFHFGYYYAESLLISEAGFTAGAIQVAGTTAVSQLPFFITSCDYTLIGEELYAAAAYISKDPQILTNLKLSDYAKLTIGILFIIGTILLTINSEWTFLQDIFHTR